MTKIAILQIYKLKDEVQDETGGQLISAFHTWRCEKETEFTHGVKWTKTLLYCKGKKSGWFFKALLDWQFFWGFKVRCSWLWDSQNNTAPAIKYI